MVGHYFRTLDDKKRLVLPAIFRKEVGDKVFATYGPDKVLELRTVEAFEELKSRLLSKSMLNKTMRKFTRLLLGNTIELKIDKLGRMNLPEEFLTLAAIDKEVAFVGVGDKIEIWDKNEFGKFQASTEAEESLDELADKLFDQGVEV